jgi:hypothetical protein
MSGSSEDLLMHGQLHGKIAGITRKEWSLLYLEVTGSHIHIFEGHDDPNAARKHLRSLEINSNDSVTADKEKKQFKFTLKRADGNYVFKCGSEYMRQKWIAAVSRLISKKEGERIPGFSLPGAGGDVFEQSVTGRKVEAPKKVEIPRVPPGDRYTLSSSSRSKMTQSAVHQPLPVVPGSSLSPGAGGDSGSNSPNDSGGASFSSGGNVRFSKMSTRSDDSGLGVSDNGQVFRQHHSGGETHRRPSIKTTDMKKSSSDSGQFDVREELDNYQWYWGHMNRVDSEARMKAEGSVGNFAIRVNASGHFVMTFWRTDGIHHHRIIHQLGIYRFERTVVTAEGNSLVDLLDNYMKKCTDKKIVPIGGVLHLVYDEAWNPPEIDMDQLQQTLSAQKRRKDRQKVLADVLQQSPQPANPRARGDKKKKEEYTMVSPTSQAREDEFTQSVPASSAPKFRVESSRGNPAMEKVLPSAFPVIPAEGKKKQLPMLPTKAKPSSGTQQPVNKSPSDKRHSPLPPTPVASPSNTSQSTSSSKSRPAPVPTPRGGGGLAKNTMSPTAPGTRNVDERDRSSSPASSTTSTSLSPPPQDQAIYENTSFNSSRGKRNKKSPVPVPTPRSTNTSTTSDEGGHEVYQNTDFGDASGDPDLYANVPVSKQRQRSQNGHTHKTERPHKPYQNVGSADTGTEYQNIQYPGRGQRRKH